MNTIKEMAAAAKDSRERPAVWRRFLDKPVTHGDLLYVLITGSIIYVLSTFFQNMR